MADNPLLPGTDIEVVEKYAPGKRLDFPAFASVCKTTFSKGIITDFEKISDDPIEVKSRVKVEVDGQESDYIPLFFHPKAQYWDDEFADPPILATDFNEEGGHFEKAWMSFRCEDEVAVMLKEGVPVAVLGHADGVPRIGENIIKIEFTTEGAGSTGHVTYYPEHGIFYIDSFGLSDFDFDAPSQLYLQKKRLLDRGSYAEYTNFDRVGPQLPEPSPDGTSLGLLQECEILCHREQSWVTTPGPYGLTIQKKAVMKDFAIIVGPILYVLQFVEYRNTWAADGVPPTIPPSSGYSGRIQGVWISAILYSKARLDAIKAASNSLSAKEVHDVAMLNGALGGFEPWGIKYPDVVPQMDFYSDFYHSYCGFDSANLDLLKIYTRPHTKVELQEAGMWPGAEE